MADKENDETSAPEEAVEDATAQNSAETQAPESPPAESEPEGQPAESEPEAPSAESEPEPETPPAESEPEAPQASVPTPAPSKAEPEEQLAPKERRRRERSKHTGEPSAARTAEERHADRVALRKAKALSRRRRRAQEREKASKRVTAAATPEALPPVHASVQGARRVRQGIVVSSKADKTITVRIDTARQHRRYEKTVRSSSKLHAHDEGNEAHEGDVVRVIESRPLSRIKRWKLVDVLERAR